MADHGFDLDAVKLKLGGHSVFAPSSSAMWLYCSGSLIPNLLAEDDAGEDAAYGTVGHGVGEKWLIEKRRPSELVGVIEEVREHKQTFYIEIDERMLDYVEEYVNWVQALPGVHYIEQRVDFSQLTPIDDQGGTADHVACEPGVLTITDLKMGKGVQVFAYKNTQCRIYALGAFYKWDHLYHFKRIVIRIAQPRLNHFDTWEITREELLEFAEFVRERAAAAWQPNAPRNPGEKQCQWCRVKAGCGPFAVKLLELSEGVFQDLDAEVDDHQVVKLKERLDDPFEEFAPKLIPVANLDTKHLASIYPWRKTFENWLKSVEDELERRLHAGEKVPGQKLVEGRSNRVFSGGDSRGKELAELMFGVEPDDMIKQSTISPAQLEDVLCKKYGWKRRQLGDLMATLTYRPRGKPVMAPEHDKRPALTVSTDDVFEDLDAVDDDL